MASTPVSHHSIDMAPQKRSKPRPQKQTAVRVACHPSGGRGKGYSLDFRQLNMKMTSDDETMMMSDVPHPFVIGPAPSQASQAAANAFLSRSTERTDAIRALVRLPPDVMAAILLANIPVDYSVDRGETNKIFEALDYVKAGIQHRAKHRGVYFCNSNVKLKLPEETFTHVLGFLDQRDLIDNVSQVSYAWAKASLSPNVRRWQTIDFYKPPTVINDNGSQMLHSTKIDTGDLLLQMLQRPQFALLKKLVVHCDLTDSLIQEIAQACPQFALLKNLVVHCDLTDSMIEAIAQACPRLEELRESRRSTIAFSSEMLHKLPTLFPELNRIGVAMNTPSSTQDVIRLVETIGTRLIGLEVEAHLNLDSGFTEEDIVSIGRHCPNLRRFSYWSIKTNDHSVMTKRGLAALVEGCPKLEELRLVGTCSFLFDLEVFGYIALNAKNLRFLDVSAEWMYQRAFIIKHETIRKHFAKRLESCVLFQYRLLPLP